MQDLPDFADRLVSAVGADNPDLDICGSPTSRGQARLASRLVAELVMLRPQARERHRRLLGAVELHQAATKESDRQGEAIRRDRGPGVRKQPDSAEVGLTAGISSRLEGVSQ